MSSPARRIGVLGSLCNPPHVGHAALARQAVAQLGLAHVLLVPTGHPSHRPEPAEPPAIRLRLAVAAAADEPVFVVSPVEVERAGPSYMADTLEVLAEQHADAELVLLLGADQAATLDHWHEPERVRALAMIAVAPRPGAGPIDDAAVLALALPLLEVSSSDIRGRVARGDSIDGLVTPAVEALIVAAGLYGPEAAG